MIQRIQSVYLLLGAVALGILFAFDTPWTSTAAAQHAWFEPALIGLIVVTGGTALGAIFLYANRPRQRTVVVGTQVLTFVLALVLYGGLYLENELAIRTGGSVLTTKAVVLLLPVAAYLFFWLARRGIDHDIELVESMDRLR
jgi:hypothetical protein